MTLRYHWNGSIIVILIVFKMDLRVHFLLNFDFVRNSAVTLVWADRGPLPAASSCKLCINIRKILLSKKPIWKYVYWFVLNNWTKMFLVFFFQNASFLDKTWNLPVSNDWLKVWVIWNFQKYIISFNKVKIFFFLPLPLDL